MSTDNLSRCPVCAGDSGSPLAPTVSTWAGGEIPPDGYYIALVNHDTGGELRKYVRVADKKAYSASGYVLNDGACSEFKSCNTWDFVYGFPRAAAAELDELRAEKARLDEELKNIKAALADPDAVWANLLRGTIAMPPHIPELEGRLTDAHALAERFQRAGQDAIDYIDGKHRDAGRVLDGWRKANK
jgi:hypothetical protein